jgi:HlyD family secretion protein
MDVKTDLKQTKSPALVERVRALGRAAFALPSRIAPGQRRALMIWAAAGAVLAIFLLWALWPRAIAVDIAMIDRGAVTSALVDEGRTRIHDVYRVSAPVAGRLSRVEAEAGDSVRRGEVLAVIAPAPPALLDARLAAETQAGIAAARAALAGAEARRRLAEADQGRVALLARRGFASPAALDAANANLRAARADVAAARADLARAQASAGGGVRAVRATDIISPAAGRVLRVLEESETIVAAGAPLLEIGDPADLEIIAEFLSQDAVLMRAGMRAFIENWGGEGALAARVTRIEPYAHTKVSALGVEEQRVNVVLRLDQAAATPMGHGFRVDVRVIVNETGDAIRIPVDALVRDGDAWSAWRIEGGRARRVRLELEGDGGAYRVVRAGLAEGARVIVFPSEQLREGQNVRPRD